MTEKHYNLQILRGLETNKSLLSSSTDGTAVSLHSQDDGAGLQQWIFIPVPGEVNIYNIRIVSGVSTKRVFLSCTPDGKTVDLYHKDDVSGRQRWELIPVLDAPTPNTYLIRVAGGMSSSRVFLSCTKDGKKVDLYGKDDGSGRQRWQLQEI